VELSLSVNLSVNDLADRELVDALILDAEGLDGALTLEVTETAAMHDPDTVLAAVLRLHQHGIRISLDDFGTGYSSLSYLQRLAPDELKIDRSFISRLMDSRSDRAIVRTSIQLAHDLGATVTAEGIEDVHTLDWLAHAGCDAAQGFAIGRPMPVDELLRNGRVHTRLH
jgi:EAL domain-containing protein (putative c-di-GMP-specific phosphodiesterase class I)